MPENNQNIEDFDLDQALTLAEREVWGPFVNAAQEIKPRAEFASALESSLRSISRTEVTLPTTQVSVARPREVTIAPKPLRLKGFRLTLVAVTLSAAMVALLLLTLVRTGNNRTAYDPVKDYLPPGKVHHLVIEHTFWTTEFGSDTPTQAPMTTTQDVWLANDNGRYIMYSVFAPVTDTGYAGEKMWVTADAVYDYNHSGGPVGYILKYPYNPSYPQRYLPDPNTINDWSTAQGNQVVGHGRVDDRPVIEIETDPATIPTPAAPSSGDKVRVETVDHVWLDTQTLQMVKLNRQAITVRGPYSGRIDVSNYHLLSDELLDRSSLPPDFFTFKAPAGVSVLDSDDPIANPLLTPTPGPATFTIPSDEEIARLLVPQGKVRHKVSVITFTEIGSNPSTTFITDTSWLVNGPKHLLAYSTKEVSGEPTLGQLWVTDENVFNHNYLGRLDTMVYKYPYNSYYITPLGVADYLRDLLKLPGTTVGRKNTVDGHEVVEVMNNLLEPTSTSGSSPNSQQFTTDTHYWIDTKTYQVVRTHIVTTYSGGNNDGDKRVQDGKTLVDELLDASSLPEDFFEFKKPPNADVVESADPLAAPSTPTKP